MLVVEESVAVYKCEVCGKQSLEMYNVTQCELKHRNDKCQHKWLKPYFGFDCSPDDGSVGVLYLERFCAKCQRYEQLNIDMDNDELRQAIWDLAVSTDDVELESRD